MESDRKKYNIHTKPYFYACYILTFVSEILLDLAIGEDEKSVETKEKRYDNYAVRLPGEFDGKVKLALRAICNQVIDFTRAFNIPKIMTKELEIEMPVISHARYLKSFAILEFTGAIVRNPNLLKITADGCIDIKFLSVESRQAIHRVVAPASHTEGVKYQVRPYSPFERRFV